MPSSSELAHRDDAPALPVGCTFDPDDWYRLARCWFPVLRVADVSAAPRAATLLDQPLVAYRINGHIVVAKDACPHRGVPLSTGIACANGIRCRYHGLLFGDDGRCIEVPSQPGHPLSARLNLVVYDVVERYDLVWICLWQTGGGAPDIPAIPLWDTPGVRRTVCPEFRIDAFAGRQLEGFLDVAHFAWVHTATFADPDQPGVPSYQVHDNLHGFSADYVSSVSNYARSSPLSAPDGFLWRRHFEVHLPFAASLTIDFPHGGQLVVGNLASPVSSLRTTLFAPIVQTFNTDQDVEEIHAFNLRVFEEDRALVESQRPRNFPQDVRQETHIRADRSSLAYRRALAHLGYGRFFADSR